MNLRSSALPTVFLYVLCLMILGGAALYGASSSLAWAASSQLGGQATQDSGAQAAVGQGTDATDAVVVLIELDQAPAVRAFVDARAYVGVAEATVRAQAALQQIDRAQTVLLAAEPLQGAEPIFRMQRAFNGVAVRLDPSQIEAVVALPGVVAVHLLPIYTIERSQSVASLGAPGLWSQLSATGLDGEAVSIGIIDTGIDYLHTDFGGPGRGYGENDPTHIDDGVAFPTVKVVGGYDFAGDEYNAYSSSNATPQPDPDPMDCWGHGTHVAGIAAGYGTRRNGATYTGAYDADLDVSTFDIAPGVAPRAELYALKVFGCEGGSQLIGAAVEWAVDPNQDGDFSDRLDVLNLSLGSPFGELTDPSVIALDNAALAGVAVVAAAGNHGDTYYIVASPSVADRAISVAASSGLQMASFSGRGPRRGDSALKPDVSAPGVNIVSALAHTGRGKVTNSGTSMATPHVAGAVALLRQRHPSWRVDEIKALILNTAHDDMALDNTYPLTRYGAGRSGAGRLDLAAAAAANVILYNGENPGQTSLSMGAPTIQGEVTALRNLRLANKSALTQTLYLTYTPVLDLPGVSFTVAGVPTYTLAPYEIRNVPVLFSADAATMRNYADPTVAQRTHFPRHLLNEETGFLYAWPVETPFRATLSPVLPASGDDPAGQGDAFFQLDPAIGMLTYQIEITGTEQITLTSADLRYAQEPAGGASLHQLLDEPQIGERLTLTGAVQLSPEELLLLAGKQIVLEITQDDMDVRRGHLQPQDAVLRLPLYAAPQPAATVQAGTHALDVGVAITGIYTLPLTGQGILSAGRVEDSAFPTDTVSLVTALELQIRSPRAIGAPEQASDIQYVGIAVTPPVGRDSGEIARRRILFGIATYGPWSTLNEVAFRIYFDTNEDGNVDYSLYTTSLGSYLGSNATDEFITVLEDFSLPAEKVTYFVNLISAAEFNTALFNNNVLLLAVDAADLGLSEENSDFSYLVSARSLDGSDMRQTSDLIRLLHYDVARPGVWVDGENLGELPIFYDLPGATLQVYYDRHGFVANRSRGLLLLHHHNAVDLRAEVVEIEARWQLHLPDVYRSPGVRVLD